MRFDWHLRQRHEGAYKFLGVTLTSEVELPKAGEGHKESLSQGLPFSRFLASSLLGSSMNSVQLFEYFLVLFFIHSETKWKHES